MSEPTDYLFKISKKNHKSTSEMPDVIPINRLKAKLFQFHDNYRHPYYGTWRKRSKFVTGRRPFSTSDKTMDYEYDSDQDWEDDPSDGDECKSDEEDNEKEKSMMKRMKDSLLGTATYPLAKALKMRMKTCQSASPIQPRIRTIFFDQIQQIKLNRKAIIQNSCPPIIVQVQQEAVFSNETYSSLNTCHKLCPAEPLLEWRAASMTAKLRQHSLSSVRKLQELLHDCNVQLSTFRNAVQQLGTASDTLQLSSIAIILTSCTKVRFRRELEISAKAVVRSCETTKNCVLPQLKHEGVEFTRHASQFIGCVSACALELKRCESLERTYKVEDAPSCIASPHIAMVEEMLETLENLVTVHYGEKSENTKVPVRRRTGTCRPQCICSKLKTSYA
uniref:Chromatin assembly factor 1 subunit A dimerization domain-containing protein n=1 Tax=Ditylenchus dipsaci TaxID=166011 RepID=A0A915ET15_9BILA